jgi:hypothetical protein
MSEATMQAQIVGELASRWWLIDHSRPGLDLSPEGVVRLVETALRTKPAASQSWQQWLKGQLSKRYRTALQGQAGKPDLLCVRPEGGREHNGLVVPGQCRARTLFAELKTLEGKVTPEQVQWLKALVDSGAEVWIVDPSNLGEFYERTVPLDSPALPGLHAPDRRYR